MKSWVILSILLVVLGSAVNASTILVSQDKVALAIEAGNYYTQQEEYAAALQWFDKAIEIDQSSSLAHHNKGVVYHSMGQTQDAIASFQHAIREDASYAKAHYSLALEYYYQKQYEGAIEELKQVIELEPNNANAHFDLGVMYIEQFRLKEDVGTLTQDDLKELEQGLTEYQTVLSLEPQFAHASQNAAIVESVLNNYLQ